MTLSRNFETLQTDSVLNGVGVTTGTTSGSIDLTTYDGCVVQIQGTWPGSPTDNLVVSFYASLDGTNWDKTAFNSITMLNSPSPNQMTFVVRDVAMFQVTAASSGTTNTITVTMNYRRWNWTSI